MTTTGVPAYVFGHALSLAPLECFASVTRPRDAVRLAALDARDAVVRATADRGRRVQSSTPPAGAIVVVDLYEADAPALFGAIRASRDCDSTTAESLTSLILASAWDCVVVLGTMRTASAGLVPVIRCLFTVSSKPFGNSIQG